MMIGTLKNLAQSAAATVYANDYPRRIKLGAIARPNYAYIVWTAADLAKRLGLKRISVVEFGVAGGRGLVNFEYHAANVRRLTGIEVEVYGFDTGAGLPPPDDYRDLPYIWQESQFKMDVADLRSSLKSAKLVLGNVKDTLSSFVADHDPAPIGAISFDLDYYSSTVDAFRIFDVAPEARLPRILCYFDDIISSDLGHISDAVGVPLAIREYNANHSRQHIGALTHLEHSYAPSRRWHRQIYSFADFDHPMANSYVSEAERQLPL